MTWLICAKTAITLDLHPIAESQQHRDFQYHLCEDIMVHVNILQVQLFIHKFVKKFFDVVKLHLVDCFTYGLARYGPEDI